MLNYNQEFSDNLIITARKMENNGYFEDAKSWYAWRYIYPYTQLFYIIMTLIFVSLSAVIIVNACGIEYSIKKVPFSIFSVDEINDIPSIIPIAKGYEDINISIARYLLGQYVSNRESYKGSLLQENEWKAMLDKISNTSSHKVFSEFVRYVNTQNPNSPVIKYRLSIERIISIISVEFPANIDKPSSAKVLFKATEKSKNTANDSYWLAEIDFDIPDIYKTYLEKSDMNFTVMRYKVKKTTNHVN